MGIIKGLPWRWAGCQANPAGLMQHNPESVRSGTQMSAHQEMPFMIQKACTSGHKWSKLLYTKPHDFPSSTRKQHHYGLNCVDIRYSLLYFKSTFSTLAVFQRQLKVRIMKCKKPRPCMSQKPEGNSGTPPFSPVPITSLPFKCFLLCYKNKELHLWPFVSRCPYAIVCASGFPP